MRNGGRIKPLNSDAKRLHGHTNVYISKEEIKSKKEQRICKKCGITYHHNPSTNTSEYCDRCHSSIHDSYEDILSAIPIINHETHPTDLTSGYMED